MSDRRQNTTAALIRRMVEERNVTFAATQGDVLAHHFSRLADNETVEFDEVEQMLIALQRAGHLDRNEMTRLQASYLREAKL
jgi:hypothetical protein